MTEYRIVEVPGGYYKIQYLNKLSIREYMDFDNAYSIGRAKVEIERLMAYDAARYVWEPVKVVSTYASDRPKDTNKTKFTNNLHND